MRPLCQGRRGTRSAGTDSKSRQSFTIIALTRHDDTCLRRNFYTAGQITAVNERQTPWEINPRKRTRKSPARKTPKPPAQPQRKARPQPPNRSPARKSNVRVAISLVVKSRRDAFPSTKLQQGQVWQCGDEFVRIVHLERLEVGYKSATTLKFADGTHQHTSKKDFCRLLKGATLVSPLPPKKSPPPIDQSVAL